MSIAAELQFGKMGTSTFKPLLRCKFCYFSENSCFGCEFCDTSRELLKRDRGRDDIIIAVQDRISDLPDVLLHNILSSLPTKDAVATTVLSRRWRWVYTWVTRLDFDNSPLSHCWNSWKHPHLIQRFSSFKMFVDNILQACQSEQTTTYRLHFANDCLHHCYPSRDPDHFPKMKPVDVNAWISFPLTRGVKELDINIHVREPDKLPSAIFGCQTLEVLKLNMNLNLELPPSVCLPNLKELSITVVHFPADDSLTRLASSCPSLEHMALDGYLKSSIPINISNPSLRILLINIYNDGDGARSKLVLDVPNLENFDYLDCNASCYSIGDLNSLVEAKIDVDLWCMSDEVLESIWGLINPMSNVRSLFLEYGFIQALVNYEFQYKLPIFRNLNHLVLGCNGYNSWNKLLLELLKCAPFLETLEYPEGIMFEIGGQLEGYGYMLVSMEEMESWSRSQVIPCCLSSHLKRIIIKKYHQTKWELEMVKCFLRKASVLEELMLVCETSKPLADKIQLGCTLQKLPRGSMTCSINVY